MEGLPWTVVVYLDVSEHGRPHPLGLAGTSLPPTGTWEGCDRGEMVVYHVVKELLPGAMRSAGERKGGVGEEEEKGRRGREGGEEERRREGWEKRKRKEGEGGVREGREKGREEGKEEERKEGGEEQKYGLSHN